MDPSTMLFLKLATPFIVFISYLVFLAFLKRKGKIKSMRLSVYGWAPVVVLIVGLFLWQLSPPPNRSVKDCLGFASIRCIDTSIRWDDSLLEVGVVFINDAGNSITITNVTASVDCTLNDVNAFSKTVLRAGESTGTSQAKR